MIRREKMMNDLKKYVKDRKKRDPEFAVGYEAGYFKFKLGVLLKLHGGSGEETKQ